MKVVRKHPLHALAVFVGTIIGVGIFGLPYVASQSGFILTVSYLAALVYVSIIFHRVLAEVACGTNIQARIPGYAAHYLGARAKRISFIATFLSLIVANIAYLLVGGRFLFLLLSPNFGGSELFYTLIFFASGAVLIYGGIKSISETEVILLAALLVLLGIFFVIALPSLKFPYFSALFGKDLLLPYGVILFSLAGGGIVPQIKDMLGGDRALVLKVITGGFFLIGFIYLLFIITVYGVTGDETSKDAMSGFGGVLGGGVVYAGYVFGIITTFTSYLTLGITGEQILRYDFGVKKVVAWAVSCCAPLVLVAAGIDDFIKVIGMTGALLVGIEGVIIMMIYRAFMRAKGRRFNPLYYGVMAVLLLGVAFEVAGAVLR